MSYCSRRYWHSASQTQPYPVYRYHSFPQRSPAKQTFGIGDTGIGESLRPQLEKNALLGGEYFPVGLPYFIDRRQCRPIITGRHVNFYQIVVNLVGIARTGKLVQETFEHTHRVIERRSRAIIQAERIVVKRRFPNLTVVIPL